MTEASSILNSSTTPSSSPSSTEALANGINSPTQAEAERKYSRIFAQKDARIHALESEAKKLKDSLGQKSSEFQARVDELVQELERHAELVDTLQTKLNQLEAKQKPKVVQRRPPNHSLNQQRPNGNASKSNSELMMSKVPASSDEICAALSSFVEKNKQQESGGLNIGTTPESVTVKVMNSNHYSHHPRQQPLGKSRHHRQQQDSGNQANSVLECINKLVAPPDAHIPNTNNNNHNSSSFLNASSIAQQLECDAKFLGEDLSSINPTNLLAFLLEGGGSPTDDMEEDEGIINEGKDDFYTPKGQAPKNGAMKEGAGHKSNLKAANGASSHHHVSVPKPQNEEEARTIALMQQRVASNVAKVANLPLNTMEIAKQCKRLMLAYNIGQRLFAKAVMCQVVKSQGSLSELLSKPRVWHKLTDKGREAFRRIYGWLSDDTAIEMLCSLSPRRVAMPCDKIEHPTPKSLLESYSADEASSGHVGNTTATSEMSDLETTGSLASVKSVVKVVDENEEDRKPKFPVTNIIVTKTLPSSPPPTNSTHLNSHSTSTPPAINISSARSNSSRWRHDDIPKEKIIGIFEAEKAKLREQETTLERAMSARSASPTTSSSSIDGAIRKVRSYLCEDQQQQLHYTRSSAHSMGSMSERDDLSPSSFRGRAEPTPILQEQFERYPVLDTEEVVKQVKDYLSRNSVSQRQFGESVLGLSQGSVSDLLARPKCWSMLTHKGREPFIRMKLFLDNENNEYGEQHANLSNGASEGIDGYSIIERNEEDDGDFEAERQDTPELLPDEVIKSILERMKAEPNSEMSYMEGQDTQKSSAENSISFAEVDTTDVARRVKDFLAKNGISQRIFGEQVMGVTSGSVSDLLSRPKPWIMLSWKGRESYTKMDKFLDDPHAMEVMKERAASLLAASALTPSATINKANASPMGLKTNLNEITVKEMLMSKGAGAVLSAAIGSNGATAGVSSTRTSNGGVKRRLSNPEDQIDVVTGKKIPRFQRTIITDKQKEALLFVFAHEQRPSTKTIDQLSQKLGLSSRTVTNWFHNYRTRQKAKEIKLSGETGTTVTITTQIPVIDTSDPANESWFKDIIDLIKGNPNPNNANMSADGRVLEEEGAPPTMVGGKQNADNEADEPFPSFSPTKLIIAEEETPAPLHSGKQSRHEGAQSQLDKAIARILNSRMTSK